MTTLTAAEVRAIREGLGVTAEWIADHLGVQTRTVQRWESGANAIKPFAADALLMLEAQADEQVRAQAALTSAYGEIVSPPTLVLEDGDADDAWPAGWQRMIAWRVRQLVPGLRIIDPS